MFNNVSVVSSYAMRARPFVRGAIALTACSMMGGFVLRAQSCCEKDACSNTRFLNSQIAAGYAMCCQMSGTAQDACFTDLNEKVQETQTLILTAKIACDNSDDELLKDTINRIRDIWLPKPKPVGGVVLNEMIALGRTDWLNLDVTLSRSNSPCVPVTVALIGDQVVNAEATGAASDETIEAAVTGEVAATVVSATGNQAYQACSFVIPSGTTLDMRFGEEFSNLAMSGSIAVAQTSPVFPSSGVATVGLPTNVHFTITKWGETLKLDLDKTFAHNKLEVDVNGNGTLGVALKLTSNSKYLSGLVQVGSTIYFTFPVQVAADWTSIRILANPMIPGNQITPASDVMLEGADGSFGLLSVPTGRCADNDANGVRDGADEVINAIKTTLGCEASN